MNVSLTRKLKALVDERVRSGRYQSASEVVRDALRLLDDVDAIQTLRLKALRKELSAGIRDLDRGHSEPFDRNLLGTIKARARKKLSHGR
jgi:antitoxin ParD1/3/4